MLVGNPRTGTTFLQRFLADEGFGSGMELFLMLYPSLTLQKLLRPILPLLEKVSPAKYHSTDAHQTSLSSVETDDVGGAVPLPRRLLPLRLLPVVRRRGPAALVRPARARHRPRATTPGWTPCGGAACVLHKADRNIAKLFSLAVRLPQFLERFPEAQILYMARDPLSVIPSSMSLVIGVLDRAVGFWSLPETVRKRWLDRMYKAWILLLQKFHEDWTERRSSTRSASSSSATTG